MPCSAQNNTPSVILRRGNFGGTLTTENPLPCGGNAVCYGYGEMW
jgi:hypothetical protein